MRTCGALLLAFTLAAAGPLDKKKKEEETQVLQIPRELPGAVTADTRRMAFHVSPLSAKGLLSQQVRDALKALARSNGSGNIVKLRAFVAGSGDLRRVRDLVSETFTDRRQPLPALSLVQAGALPLTGAQVVLEATVLTRREVNPAGLVFVGGQSAGSDKPLDPAGPLAEKALERLNATLAEAGADAADVLRLTCFLSSFDGLDAVRQMVAARYPGAAANYVQIQRAPVHSVVEFEAVARLRSNPGPRVRLLSPTAGSSGAAVVGAREVVLSGTQVAFGFQESDARLAFARLGKAVEQQGASLKNTVFAGLYPLSFGQMPLLAATRAAFFAQDRPPAVTVLPFEGLPSTDAAFAVDVVAAKE